MHILTDSGLPVLAALVLLLAAPLILDGIHRRRQRGVGQARGVPTSPRQRAAGGAVIRAVIGSIIGALSVTAFTAVMVPGIDLDLGRWVLANVLLIVSIFALITAAEARR